MSHTVELIAEIGVNHNGDLSLAAEMTDAAIEAGADTIKYQAFSVAGLVAGNAQTASYQAEATGFLDQAEMLENLALPINAFGELMERCESRNVAFLCTAFEAGLLAALIDLGMTRIKVPSGELDNHPFLDCIGAHRLPVILSTGMGTLNEVVSGHRRLVEAGAGSISILQCTSLYPAPAEAANLRAMTSIAEATGCPIGYSDHTEGDATAIAAVALGATIIEKHFTTDRLLPGPDQAASMEPDAFKCMARRLKETAAALGDGTKKPNPAEVEIARLARRSWHFDSDLPAGTILGPEMIKLVRPQGGLPPGDSPLGRELRRAVSKNAAVTDEDLS